MRKCAICQTEQMYEDSPILVMGPFGVPRYLCDECAEDIELATRSPEYPEAEAAIERVGEKLRRGKCDDLTVEVTSALLTDAAKRVGEIKRGEYDFSLDEVADEPQELPEELTESEEDKELDRRDEERQKKFNRIFDRITIALIAVAAAAILYKVIMKVVFKQ